MRTYRWALALGASAIVLAAIRWAGADHVPNGHLAAMGPISDRHGFPVWYEDATGLRLELCYDHLDPFCNIPPEEMPDPGAPVSFPDNFPLESLWWGAEAEMDTSAGRARLVLALEAAWAAEETRDGDQVAFTRIRIRIDVANPGVYRVVHPYGEKTFVVQLPGDRAIDDTVDSSGIFADALTSDFGPFLRWTPDRIPPPGYIADPEVLHTVTGSPWGEDQNVFRIEGPGIGTPGSPFLCNPPNLDCIETRLFSVQGKIAVTSGVDALRASYSRDAGGGFQVAAFASADPGNDLRLSLPGIGEVAMIHQGRRYVGLAASSGTIPAEATIANRSDDPPSVKSIPVQDLVTITLAAWDPVSRQLRVEAFSSDRLAPGPTLMAVGFGPLVGGLGVFADVVAPPASVTVRSSGGGVDVEPVTVGTGGTEPLPVTADAGPDRMVTPGETVALEGSAGGAFTSVLWTQAGGPAVVLSDPAILRPTFVVPDAPGSSIALRLTVDGPGGPVSDDVVFTVVEALPPPVADAGLDQVAIPGAVVVLGGASVGETFLWEQIDGDGVAVLDADDIPNPRFVFPVGATFLVFRLTVGGPGGVATDDVEIRAAIGDSLVVDRAEYRIQQSRWRVRGTATVPAPNRVSVYLSDGVTLVGTAPVDAEGIWDLDVRDSPVVPAPIERLTIRSTAGGLLERVPFVQRQ